MAPCVDCELGERPARWRPRPSWTRRNRHRPPPGRAPQRQRPPLQGSVSRATSLATTGYSSPSTPAANRSATRERDCEDRPGRRRRMVSAGSPRRRTAGTAPYRNPQPYHISYDEVWLEVSGARRAATWHLTTDGSCASLLVGGRPPGPDRPCARTFRMQGFRRGVVHRPAGDRDPQQLERGGGVQRATCATSRST